MPGTTCGEILRLLRVSLWVKLSGGQMGAVLNRATAGNLDIAFPSSVVHKRSIEASGRVRPGPGAGLQREIYLPVGDSNTRTFQHWGSRSGTGQRKGMLVLEARLPS